MTYEEQRKEYKRQQRQRQYRERKIIEGILHPCPEINGCEILHEHKGQYIIFSAYKKGQAWPINTCFYDLPRQDVLHFEGMEDEFYKHHKDNLEWITQQ